MVGIFREYSGTVFDMSLSSSLYVTEIKML